MTNKTVAVGMSGGVDSSVAAAVLKEKGYHVIGVTMRLWDGGEEVYQNTVEDARRVADALGIEHHALDFRQEFEGAVMEYFTREYLSGRTPNPCIACNKALKFGAMRTAAAELGAQKIATGHYGRVVRGEDGLWRLMRAENREKDQTYVLYHLSQEQLSGVLLPLGDFRDKETIRKKAEELALPVAQKPDSQEICFIPDNDYAGFILRRTGTEPPEGDFVDGSGHVLGRHRGILHYTIGQRKGLGIAFGKPMFVTRIDAGTNRIVLGESGTEFSSSLMAGDLNFILPMDLSQKRKVLAKVRYAAKAAPAQLWMDGGRIYVEFETPQRAVTPGQAVVFYDETDTFVLGGGTIL